MINEIKQPQQTKNVYGKTYRNEMDDLLVKNFRLIIFYLCRESLQRKTHFK